MPARDRIAQEIARQGGWIPFARYMQLALHEPGVGYYASGARKFGPHGDFVTAPELGSLFGRTLARQLREIPGGRVLELGAGTGALANVLIEELGCDYYILETSAELKQRQKELLGKKVIHLDNLPVDFEGAIIANEVADALPVHVAYWAASGEIFENGVGAGFAWVKQPAAGELLEEARRIAAPAPFVSEINLLLKPWMASLVKALARGAVFVVDYGFPRREYYHPQRDAGTLMCHYHHRSHADPFAHPGEEDITAHVDFTAAAEAAVAAGAELLGYTSQARFLLNCGITDVLEAADPGNVPKYAPLASEAHKLLSPAEMGELFKVLAVGKGLAAPLLGFSSGDRKDSLGKEFFFVSGF
jgi:SAM-dependent MidA family methyltransferase